MEQFQLSLKQIKCKIELFIILLREKGGSGRGYIVNLKQTDKEIQSDLQYFDLMYWNKQIDNETNK